MYSLVVTMDAVKLLMGVFINLDLDMYHEQTDTTAKARMSSLVEELGQIDYIFSDKTGTLTCNIMKFQRCAINGVGYSEVIPENTNFHVENSDTSFGYQDFTALLENYKKEQKAGHLHEFLTLLGVCHTVIPELDEESGKIVYQASSPDESALVNGAKNLGVIFHTRKPKSVTVRFHGEDQEFQILNVCEFNSTRKRMSSIVRLPSGKIKLYIKGADTVIIDRLKSDQKEILDSTCAYLEVGHVLKDNFVLIV